ncbi:MAG: type I 3-dehydroquinate dehydratase [Actinomadura sp.]
MTIPPPLGLRRAGTGPEDERPVSIVATLTDRSAADGATPLRPAPEVRCVEVRADLTGDVDVGAIRANFSGGLLYVLRSTAAGGACDDPEERRHERLIAAAGQYDYVELDVARDLHPTVLDRIAPERRVLSWYGPAVDLDGLQKRFAAMATVEAHLYRLAPTADTMAQALVPLLLLKSLDRDDATAYARGPVASWTRVLAARYGAAVMFGRLDDDRPDGELAARRLLADYPHQILSRAEQINGIIGSAVTMSLCPLAHNTAYLSLGLPALFLPFSTDELTRSLDELSTGLDELGLPLHGLCVVQPFKDTAFSIATETTPFARRVLAASLLIRSPSGGWWGDVEAASVVAALTGNRVEVARKRIAVIGCGGAGRAAAAALTQAGAWVTMVNRGIRSGLPVAKRLNLPFVPLYEFDPRAFDVLVHATPVKDTLPFPIDGLDPTVVVFDLTYAATETRLTTAARAAGHRTIDGKEMTLAELSRQFHRMTGTHIAAEIVRAAQHEFLQSPPSLPQGEQQR